MGLAEEELGLLREESQSWYESFCDILRPDPTDDAFGGRDSESPLTTLSEDVPCTIESGSGQENTRVMLGKIEGLQIFTVTLPALTDVKILDHLIVHSVGNAALELIVQAELTPEDWEIDRKVIASEVGDGRIV